MAKIAKITKNVTQSIYLFLYMATIFGASPRVSIGFVHRTSPQRTDNSKFASHWRKIRDQEIPDYEPTHSDIMQLFSIGAGHLVMVQKTGQSWDNEYNLNAKAKKGISGKQNKFVTETISYGKLKIRSEENKMYICAKGNGNIVYRASALNHKQKHRKRCLFTWSFTKHKHMQLSINAGKKNVWYLAVRTDGTVRLVPKNVSTDKQRSFIFIPTRSANRRPMKTSRKRYEHHRGFSLVNTDRCEFYEQQTKRQNATLISLAKENDMLYREIARLKSLKFHLSKEIKELMPLESNVSTEPPNV